MKGGLEFVDDPSELGLNLLRHLGEAWILYRLHGGDGIDG